MFTDIAYSVASRALEGTNAFLEVRRPNGVDTFTSKFHYPTPPIIDYEQGKEAVIVEFVPAKPKKGYNNARGNLVEGTEADVEKAENAFIQSMARNKNLTIEILGNPAG